MIRVVVTFCNAQPYIAKCLESIRDQSLLEWSCTIYDDCSDDGSIDAVAPFVRDDERFSVVQNSAKFWQVGNWWQFLQLAEIDDDDIIVTVDGDDWLPDCGVLARVQEAYSDNTTWITYGNFLMTGFGFTEIGDCRKVESASRIRQLPWTSSALRTFKAFLFRRIRKESLLWKDGWFYPAAGDLAAMFPMIEMAGDGRSKCLADINYIYNMANPLCDFKVREDLQQEANKFLRSLPAYQELP